MNYFYKDKIAIKRKKYRSSDCAHNLSQFCYLHIDDQARFNKATKTLKHKFASINIKLKIYRGKLNSFALLNDFLLHCNVVQGSVLLAASKVHKNEGVTIYTFLFYRVFVCDWFYSTTTTFISYKWSEKKDWQLIDIPWRQESYLPVTWWLSHFTLIYQPKNFQ